jgi:DNA-directed RNA polymerase specialized sigma24 family protein
VSAEYHKKFDVIDTDDIRQSLYEWFLEHPNKLTQWEALGEKDAKNLIYKSLRNQALDYCQRWKAKSGGYEITDLFYYESDMVEALLPSVLRGEFSSTHKLNLGRPGRPSAPAEGGNLLAMMVEIDFAYWRLSIDDRRVLFFRYAESMDYNSIARELELGSEDTARQRSNRAIRRLINKIGGFKPYNDSDSPDNQEEESES